MTDKLKSPQKALFHGIEVVNGQEIVLPSHNRVSATGEDLGVVCSSIKGVIVFFGGIPQVVPKAYCKERDSQTCFFQYK